MAEVSSSNNRGARGLLRSVNSVLFGKLLRWNFNQRTLFIAFMSQNVFTRFSAWFFKPILRNIHSGRAIFVDCGFKAWFFEPTLRNIPNWRAIFVDYGFKAWFFESILRNIPNWTIFVDYGIGANPETWGIWVSTDL